MNSLKKFEPRKWDDIGGNRSLKMYFKTALQKKQQGLADPLPNAFITGARRQGKTSGSRYGLDVLHCKQPDSVTLDKCNECIYCQSQVGRYGDEGGGLYYYDDFRGGPSDIGPTFSAIANGVILDKERVIEVVQRIEGSNERLRILMIDEAGRMPLSGLQCLLSEMDRLEFLVIATSTVQKRVTNKTNQDADGEALAAFLDRFPIKIYTEAPTRSEFGPWFERQAERVGVRLETPEVAKLAYVAANGVAGRAIDLLDQADMLHGGCLREDEVRQAAEFVAG